MKAGGAPATALGGDAQGAGIDQHLEVGTGADRVERIGRGRLRRRGVVGDQRDQFSAGRKAHHADPARVQAILGGVGPHPADRPAQVGGGVAVDRIGRSRLARQAVLQDEGGDAVAVEGLGRPDALIDEDQHAMAAARHDDDRRAVGVARVGGNTVRDGLWTLRT
jgi:hypothetical protein